MSISFKPILDSLGAEISGLDLHREITPEEGAALRDAFSRYHLLLMRDLDISAQEQSRFARVFGEITIRNGIATDAQPERGTQYISNTRKDGYLGNGELKFHQDHTFHETLLRGLMLYGMEIPKSGSQTKFRSCKSMYAAMSPDQRRRAEPVKCLHLFDLEAEDYSVDIDLEKLSDRVLRAWQPLIWTNPETGDRAPWVVQWSTVDYQGIDRVGGKALLDELWETFEEKVEEYVHDWRVGDLLLWSNRMAQHARLPFDSSEARTLRRTPLL